MNLIAVHFIIIEQPSKMSKKSPRKFRDKIALLTQKEEEGNGEFAKIIKEVEEIKNHPTSIPSNKSRNDGESEEIKAVHADLVREISEYQDEHQVTICQPPIFPFATPSQYQQSVVCPQHHNIVNQDNINYVNAMPQNQMPQVNHTWHPTSQTQAPTIMRTRVASQGSASRDFNPSLAPNFMSNPNRSIRVQGNDTYLDTGESRLWQRSSSDSALHQCNNWTINPSWPNTSQDTFFQNANNQQNSSTGNITQVLDDLRIDSYIQPVQADECYSVASGPCSMTRDIEACSSPRNTIQSHSPLNTSSQYHQPGCNRTPTFQDTPCQTGELPIIKVFGSDDMSRVLVDPLSNIDRCQLEESLNGRGHAFQHS